jgi:hypothetical protein
MNIGSHGVAKLNTKWTWPALRGKQLVWILALTVTSTANTLRMMHAVRVYLKAVAQAG